MFIPFKNDGVLFICVGKTEVEKALQLKCNKKLIQNRIVTITVKMKCKTNTGYFDFFNQKTSHFT